MCKTSKLQSSWEIKEGDWTIDTVTSINKETLAIIGGYPEFSDDVRNMDHDFKDMQRRSYCLFTQSQLQDMVYPSDAFLKLKLFSEWALSSDRCKNRDFLLLSMEQLWLAYVHYKLFREEWINDKWAKIA